MTALDQQIMFKTESTYGTPVVVDRTFELNEEGIEDDFRRTEGDPLRVNTFVERADRSTPYYGGAAGPVQLDVMTKGFGWFLTHMFGNVVTTGPTEATVYTHTATMADLLGKSFTAQVGRPFHPSGTVQPFTFDGGKITEWTLSNDVESNLVLDLSTDFQGATTATALAVAGYLASMENLTWAGGTITIGGTQLDLDEFSVKVNNGLNVDRRKIRGNTDKKEPTGGRRTVEWALKADFEDLTQRDRAAAATTAGTHAAIVAKWEGPTALGTSGTFAKPSLQINIPSCRFDKWKAALAGPEGITQELSGEGRYDGSSSPVSAVYKSADAVA